MNLVWCRGFAQDRTLSRQAMPILEPNRCQFRLAGKIIFNFHFSLFSPILYIFIDLNYYFSLSKKCPFLSTHCFPKSRTQKILATVLSQELNRHPSDFVKVIFKYGLCLLQFFNFSFPSFTFQFFLFLLCLNSLGFLLSLLHFQFLGYGCGGNGRG